MMADSKTPWTLGPWVQITELDWPVCVVPVMRPGTICSFGEAHGNPPQHRANARLIAAAPELADALELCTRAIGDWSRPTGANGMTSPPGDHPMLIAMQAAYTALAKARGEA